MQCSHGTFHFLQSMSLLLHLTALKSYSLNPFLHLLIFCCFCLLQIWTSCESMFLKYQKRENEKRNATFLSSLVHSLSVSSPTGVGSSKKRYRCHRTWSRRPHFTPMHPDNRLVVGNQVDDSGTNYRIGVRGVLNCAYSMSKIPPTGNRPWQMARGAVLFSTTELPYYLSHEWRCNSRQFLLFCPAMTHFSRVIAAFNWQPVFRAFTLSYHLVKGFRFVSKSSLKNELNPTSEVDFKSRQRHTTLLNRSQ